MTRTQEATTHEDDEDKKLPMPPPMPMPMLGVFNPLKCPLMTRTREATTHEDDDDKKPPILLPMPMLGVFNPRNVHFFTLFSLLCFSAPLIWTSQFENSQKTRSGLSLNIADLSHHFFWGNTSTYFIGYKTHNKTNQL
jgi:hypothetical protein